MTGDGLVGGTVVVSGRAELRKRGSLTLSEPRELLVGRNTRAAYLPDGGVDPETLRYWGAAETPVDDVPERMPEGEVVASCDREVIWGGSVNGHFGHFLTESVARLWPLLEGQSEPSVVFTTPSLQPFAREWFDAFGAELVDLPADGFVRFRRMRVPEPAWRIDDYVCPEMLDIHRRARDELEVAGKESGGPLWLSRTEIEEGRRVRDETLLTWALKDRVEVVCPENLSLARQVELLEAADTVMGPIGSAFHALLLCRRIPAVVYFAPARVASTFVAQDHLLGKGGHYVQTLATEGSGLAVEGRRQRHRILVPETLRAMQAIAIPGLLDDSRLARFASPELPAASPGASPDRSLDDTIATMLLDAQSVDARMRLGGALEAVELDDCALEQFRFVSDLVSGYSYAPLRAARLLSRVGQPQAAAEMAKRALASDPDSEEAARYIAAAPSRAEAG